MSDGSRYQILDDLKAAYKRLIPLACDADMAYEYSSYGIEEFLRPLRDCVAQVRGYIQTAKDTGLGRSNTVRRAERELTHVSQIIIV